MPTLDAHHKVKRIGKYIVEANGYKMYEKVLYEGNEAEIIGMPDHITVQLDLGLTMGEQMRGKRNYIKCSYFIISKKQ